MKKRFILFAIFVSLLFTSCHTSVWGGDGELLVDRVTLETQHKDLGRYKVHCIVLNGYRKTINTGNTDYIEFNSDSLYRVGDTIYIGK
jgi:hypothetical protein